MNPITIKACQQPRMPNEMDLVKDVIAHLRLIGHYQQPQIDKILSHPDIIKASDPLANSELQRLYLNMYWNKQLNPIPNSMEYRLLLLPDGDLRTWLAYFKTRVAPFIIDNNLPLME